MAVERFHRGVDIENPRLAQQWPSAIVELLQQPRPPGFLIDLAQSPTHRVLAHDLRHPKQRWIDRVAAQRGDVGVAPMPSQHRQQHRSQYVPLRRRVRARQIERTPGYPAVKQTALLQVLNEKRELPKRRHCRPLTCLPLHVNPAAKRVGNHRLGLLNLYQRLLTRRVCRNQPSIRCHVLAFEPIRQICQPSTAVFRIMA